MTVCVLLVWDQAMVHGVLSALLSLEKDIEIVAEESRGDEVLSAALAPCQTWRYTFTLLRGNVRSWLPRRGTGST